jgi:hypothetical protein
MNDMPELRSVFATIDTRRRVTLTAAIAAISLYQQRPAINAHGATIDFNRISVATRPPDPNAVVSARAAYVDGSGQPAVQGPFAGTSINLLVGADAFYEQGFTGANAAVASIEGGHIWNGHETLTHVLQIPNQPIVLNEADRHATWVGMILGGRRSGANSGPYQEGMAPNAQLFSGAFATQYVGQRYTGDISDFSATVFDPYRRAFSNGMNVAERRADVINSSWGYVTSGTGTDAIAVGLDGFANNNPRALSVTAAANDGPGPDKVRSPGAGYNDLTVAALGPNAPYDTVAAFSSGGPNDYADPVNGTLNDARQVVDIAAPGQNLSSAYYGGETGGNGTTDNPAVIGPGPTGPPSGPAGGPDFYSRGLFGTSFATPTVAGGAALLYDAAYSAFPTNDNARDARVIKAALMNSADKTTGWNNAQTTHPNGNGGVRTTQGLDNQVGTGRMNLDAAYDQFLAGTTDVPGLAGGNLGPVDNVGWDLGEVAITTTNDYYFDTPLLGSSTFTATLTWFRDRRIDAANNVFDDSYDDLNLELWSVEDGTATSLISESSSLYNNSEHFSFTLPFTGEYALRVRWLGEVFDTIGDMDQESYGLAWSAVAAIPGDFNHDGAVDAADYVVWRRGFGTLFSENHYEVWRAHFGKSVAIIATPSSIERLSAAVPEPANFALGVAGLIFVCVRNRTTGRSRFAARSRRKFGTGSTCR